MNIKNLAIIIAAIVFTGLIAGCIEQPEKKENNKSGLPNFTAVKVQTEDQLVVREKEKDCEWNGSINYSLVRPQLPDIKDFVIIPLKQKEAIGFKETWFLFDEKGGIGANGIMESVSMVINENPCILGTWYYSINSDTTIPEVVKGIEVMRHGSQTPVNIGFNLNLGNGGLVILTDEGNFSLSYVGGIEDMVRIKIKRLQ